jgi:hypothetical protein
MDLGFRSCVWVALFLAPPSVLWGQWVHYPSRAIGSIEATFAPSEIVIKRGRQEWRIELSNIVRAMDCGQPRGPGGAICTGSQRSLCPDCARVIPEFVAWDEVHQRFYFAFSTYSGSWERPYQVLSYSLATRQSSRLINTWSGAFSLGTVSRSGQYLAYVKVHHVAPAAGCVDQRDGTYNVAIYADIEIVDLWAHTIGKPRLALPESEGAFIVDKLEWASPTTLSYVVSRHHQDCSAFAGEQPTRLDVDVNGVHFQ